MEKTNLSESERMLLKDVFKYVDDFSFSVEGVSLGITVESYEKHRNHDIIPCECDICETKLLRKEYENV